VPIFEYICTKCGCRFEVLEKFSKTAIQVCPNCGSSDVEKQFSVFNAAVKQGQSKKCHGCSDLSCPHSKADY